MAQTTRDANPKTHVLKQRLGSDVIASLDDWQRDALDQALQSAKWSNDHPLNIRFSIPFFKSRYYLTIVGGQEKRGFERRREERTQHPLHSLMNILFALGVVSGASVLMLVFLALYSSIIEF